MVAIRSTLQHIFNLKLGLGFPLLSSVTDLKSFLIHYPSLLDSARPLHHQELISPLNA